MENVTLLESQKRELEKSMEAEKTHLESKIKSLSNDIARHATEKVRLEYEIKKRTADKVRAEQENQKLKEAEVGLRADAKLLRDDLNRAKNELAVLKSSSCPTDSELESLTKERDTLQDEVGRLQQLLQQAETAIDHLVNIQSTRASP